MIFETMQQAHDVTSGSTEGHIENWVDPRKQVGSTKIHIDGHRSSYLLSTTPGNDEERRAHEYVEPNEDMEAELLYEWTLSLDDKILTPRLAPGITSARRH